jgi:3-oxoacyl-[acyl-carrier-protein] synthase-3
MSDVQVSIRGADYELGEHEIDHRDVRRFAEKIAEYQMVDDAGVWGWGRFFASTRDRAELAVASARRSLAKADRSAADVDAVILCAAEFPVGVAAHAGYCRAVLAALDLGHAFVVGVTLGRCTTMLSAIQLAHGLVAGQVYRNVLVIASDRITDEEDRFQNFAFFSDAAASCVITAAPGGELAIRATAFVLDVPALDSSARVDARLGRTSIDAITDRSAVSAREIALVLPSNLFVPIVRMNERQSGFRPDQLYLRNIAERGHCFSADAIVNLVDSRPADGWRAGDHLLLTSTVPGARVSILLTALDGTKERTSMKTRGVERA